MNCRIADSQCSPSLPTRRGYEGGDVEYNGSPSATYSWSPWWTQFDRGASDIGQEAASLIRESAPSAATRRW